MAESQTNVSDTWAVVKREGTKFVDLSRSSVQDLLKEDAPKSAEGTLSESSDDGEFEVIQESSPQGLELVPNHFTEAPAKAQDQQEKPKMKAQKSEKKEIGQVPTSQIFAMAQRNRPQRVMKHFDTAVITIVMMFIIYVLVTVTVFSSQQEKRALQKENGRLANEIKILQESVSYMETLKQEKMALAGSIDELMDRVLNLESKNREDSLNAKHSPAESDFMALGPEAKLMQIWNGSLSMMRREMLKFLLDNEEDNA